METPLATQLAAGHHAGHRWRAPAGRDLSSCRPRPSTVGEPRRARRFLPGPSPRRLRRVRQELEGLVGGTAALAVGPSSSPGGGPRCHPLYGRPGRVLHRPLAADAGEAWSQPRSRLAQARLAAARTGGSRGPPGRVQCRAEHNEINLFAHIVVPVLSPLPSGRGRRNDVLATSELVTNSCELAGGPGRALRASARDARGRRGAPASRSQKFMPQVAQESC